MQPGTSPFIASRWRWSIRNSPRSSSLLMMREWYMHPNGQFPAYEWAFGDVNPPVHAWAAWRVYKIEQETARVRRRVFLERVFQKLLLNFTWWVNRKDAEGKNIFQGGFLGLDNIGVFDRSAPLPTGGHIEQSDGTGWMAMYSLNLLAIAMELAREDSSYEDVASKFCGALRLYRGCHEPPGARWTGLWDEEDGFFYDVLHLPNGEHFPMKVRSMVGLIPLFAVETLEPEMLDKLPGFKRRLEWFVENRPDLTANSRLHADPRRRHSAGCCPSSMGSNLPQVLRFMLDEGEFLSPLRHPRGLPLPPENPYMLAVNGTTTGWTTSRPNRAPACSAGTPTGAGRSGFR